MLHIKIIYENFGTLEDLVGSRSSPGLPFENRVSKHEQIHLVGQTWTKNVCYVYLRHNLCCSRLSFPGLYVKITVQILPLQICTQFH